MLDLKTNKLYEPGKEDEGKSRMLQNEIEKSLECATMVAAVDSLLHTDLPM